MSFSYSRVYEASISQVGDMELVKKVPCGETEEEAGGCESEDGAELCVSCGFFIF